MINHLRKLTLVVTLIFAFCSIAFSQVNTGGTANTSNHQKQIIGYITNWDAWKSTAAGVPGPGALTHLNIDYSKYTTLNYSFFGVAVDGSIHSGDLRNKNIYMPGVDQQPADIIYTDIYSSWDMYLIFGEVDPIQYISAAVATECTKQGFQVVEGGTTWSQPTWGLYNKPLPVPMHKVGGAPGVIDLAHQKGVKVVATVGGWSMSKHFSTMAADPAKRATFINDCKKLIAMGFDGIDIDWEFIGPYAGMNATGNLADYTNFTTLMTELRAAIGPNKQITAAFSPDPIKFAGVEFGKLKTIMNYFNFMTYDYNGGWSNKAGHNSPLYDYPNSEAPTFNWKSTFDNLVTMGVPSNMINMGAPFYGRGFVTTAPAVLNGATQKQNLTVQPDGPISSCADFTNWPLDVYDGTPAYNFINQKALGAGSGWTRYWDNDAKVPYLTKGNYFLSYDDEESIGYKAQFIVDNKMAGAIVWTVFEDLDISGTTTTFGTKLVRYSTVKSPLVNKINEVFATDIGPKSPTVTITSPLGGTNFTANSNITINATAADADGTVTKVDFYQGTTLIGTSTTSPYSFTWNTVATGTYQLKAIATDNTNLTGTSSVVTITVGTVPLVANAGGPYTGTTNTSVSFTASATGGTSPYTYSWNFGDGGSATGITATHTYATAAKFNVVLTVTDKNSVIATANTTADITAIIINGCGTFPVYPAGIGSYVAGSKVIVNSTIYEAKPYPYLGWANMNNAAYAPGTGSNWTDCWTLDGPCSTVSVNQITENQLSFNCFPNPANDNVMFNFNLPQSGLVSIAIYDITGLNVSSINHNYDNSGEFNISLNTTTLASGVYFVRLIANDETKIIKLVIAK